MFARTPRLTLRPPWPEDAPALTQAITHESVVTMLARAPWPFALPHAEAWLESPRGATDVDCVILRHDTMYPEVSGVISLTLHDGMHELGYWLTPSAWGRGYATEAGKAMLGMARYALALKQLRSSYFLDNAASGRVLSKLGFRRTGETLLHSAARGHAVPCATLELELAEDARAPVFGLAA